MWLEALRNFELHQSGLHKNISTLSEFLFPISHFPMKILFSSNYVCWNSHFEWRYENNSSEECSCTEINNSSVIHRKDDLLLSYNAVQNLLDTWKRKVKIWNEKKKSIN